METPSLTQFRMTPGVIDLSWGQPALSLLPVERLQAAAARTLETLGPEALSYGAPAGPPPLIEFVRERLAVTDGRAPATDQILVTAGASHGLDLVATHVLRPGDSALVDVPTYHLAMGILRDYPIGLVAVASDHEGILLDDLAAVVADLRRRGERPRLLYTIPTFRNPTGSTLPAGRRAALLTFAAAEDLLVVEDDTYRELAYDGPAPHSLWADDAADRVIRLGSFAKSVAPGLRVGYVTATRDLVARIAGSGLFESGGGATHFAGMVLAEYARVGDYAAQVERFRNAYRAQRDALLAALAEHLTDTVAFTRPAGGYFTWLDLPPGVAVRDVAAASRAGGVDFVGAGAFFVNRDAAPQSLRLSFSMYPPAELAEAGARLAAAIRTASPSARRSGPP